MVSVIALYGKTALKILSSWTEKQKSMKHGVKQGLKAYQICSIVIPGWPLTFVHKDQIDLQMHD